MEYIWLVQLRIKWKPTLLLRKYNKKGPFLSFLSSYQEKEGLNGLTVGSETALNYLSTITTNKVTANGLIRNKYIVSWNTTQNVYHWP